MLVPCSFHWESNGIPLSRGTPGRPVAARQSSGRTTPVRSCLEVAGSLWRRLSCVAADTERLCHAKHMHICTLSAPEFTHKLNVSYRTHIRQCCKPRKTPLSVRNFIQSNLHTYDAITTTPKSSPLDIICKTWPNFFTNARKQAIQTNSKQPYTGFPLVLESA